jgi:hypothetical protein
MNVKGQREPARIPAVYMRKRLPVAASAQALVSPHQGGLLNKTLTRLLPRRLGNDAATRYSGRLVVECVWLMRS